MSVVTKEQLAKDLMILEATPDVDRLGRSCRSKNINMSKLTMRKKGDPRFAVLHSAGKFNKREI